MIKESQEKYLSTLPDGKTIIVKQFDPIPLKFGDKGIDLVAGVSRLEQLPLVKNYDCTLVEIQLSIAGVQEPAELRWDHNA